jgi:UDP-N-acetylmuramyl pentapeptide phosphotransferase/UDP-N-acetylglucosamine-1-phosphate transferase
MAAAWYLTRQLIPLLHQWGYIDRPNERSSHATPVVRGGGLALVAVLVIPLAISVWELAGRRLSPALLLLAFLGLAAISWSDDRKSLPVAVRLLAQAAAVCLGLLALPPLALVFQGYLPLIADRFVAALIWLWFINLYNFMDGIDGISGAETASIGLGVAMVAFVAGITPALANLGMALAGAACGFLLWNWTPARLFLGDVGSIPLGFLVGFVLLCLAGAGQPLPAIILPLYYLFDATSTLLRRIANREPIWLAHRTHAYQAAAAVTSHPAVVCGILALNGCLVLLALAAAWVTDHRWVAVAATVAATIGTGQLVLHFRQIAGDTFWGLRNAPRDK